MADSENEFPYGFVDRRRAPGQVTGVGTISGSNYNDVGSMRSRLAAVNPTYYTATLLNSLTKNDMRMALRQADDAAGI